MIECQAVDFPKLMMKTSQSLPQLGVTAVAVSLLALYWQPTLVKAASPEKSFATTTTIVRSAEAYNNQGVELAEQGKFPEAIAAFKQAIQIYPKYENAHNNLGLAFGSQQKYIEAVAAFNQALTINPSNFETYNNLGIALGSQGKFSEAVAAFHRAIEINPVDPISHQNLGIAFWSQGEVSAAVDSLQKARQLFSEQKNKAGMEQVEAILRQVTPANGE